MSMTVETVEARTIASIRDSCAMEEMADAMGRGFGRIMSLLSAQGAAPVGPPMTIYPEPVAEGAPLVFETAVPVPRGTRGDDVVQVSEMPTAHVAVFMHEGPYSELGRTYMAAAGQMREAGLLPGGGPREIYLNDPGETPPEQLLTRIEFPVFEPD